MSEQEIYLNSNSNGANNGGGAGASGGDERIAFGSMAKGQKKYGTIITPHRLTRSMTEEQPAFVYEIQPGDTMQGIAVKFGITTEQIRRANQMWTHDSLFLRAKLLIPYSADQDICNGHERHHRPNQSLGSNSSFSEVHIDLHGHGHGGGGGHVNASNISSPQEEMSCTSTSTVSNSNSKHWTHPLSDSFESEDCTVSPSSVRLETDSTASVSPYPMNGKSYHNQGAHNSSASSSSHMIWSPNINDCNNSQAHNRNINDYSSPQSHSTPTSPKARNYFVRDHSEKSAEDFLARIDSAIESKKRQVKLSAENFNSKPWVTFESDSESDQRQSSRTSLRTEGKHLRYSLRKLEKTQDEIFEL